MLFKFHLEGTGCPMKSIIEYIISHVCNTLLQCDRKQLQIHILSKSERDNVLHLFWYSLYIMLHGYIYNCSENSS